MRLKLSLCRRGVYRDLVCHPIHLPPPPSIRGSTVKCAVKLLLKLPSIGELMQEGRFIKILNDNNSLINHLVYLLSFEQDFWTR